MFISGVAVTCLCWSIAAGFNLNISSTGRCFLLPPPSRVSSTKVERKANTDSIKQGARTCADGMMSYYHGNESGQTPGLLPQP